MAVNANVAITFSENVSIANASQVRLRRSSNNSEVAASKTVSGRTLTINPSSNLANSTGYYVTIGNAAIQDAAGNNFAGISGNTAYNFTTVAPVDNTPPSIVSRTPLPNTLNFPVDANIVIEFDEPIKNTNPSSIGLFKTSGQVPVPINFNIAGNTLTIDPIDDLDHDILYYIQFIGGGISDLSNNPFFIFNTSEYEFGTAPVPGPTVVNQSPLDNATNVAVNTDVTITFSEAILLVNPSLARLRRVSNNSEVPASKTVSGNVLTINPNSNLSSSTDYYVSIGGGAIDGLMGNSFEGISGSTAYNFTTAAPIDNTPPTISSRNPVDNATNVAVNANVAITFSEDVSIANASQVRLRRSSNNSEVAASKTVSGRTLTINPSSNLANSTGYYITIGNAAIRDAAGNNFAGIVGTGTYNFTTAAANTPPELLSTIPTDDATDVAIDTDFEMTFNESLTVFGGFVRLYKKQGATSTQVGIVGGFSPNESGATINGSTVTLDLAGILEPATDYYLTMNSSFVRDADFLGTTGFMDETTWNFTTAAPVDNTPPTISSRNPVDNATNVAVNANITVTFSEDVSIANASQVRLRRSSNNSEVAASKTVSGRTLTINPSSNLANSTGYYVTIGNAAIRDAAGNNFAGISGTGAYNFTTRKETQSITFNNIGNRSFSPDPFQLTATASSGLPVSYTVTAGNATVSGDMLTLTGVGSVTVRADQAGNSVFSAAVPVSRSFNVSRANQTITFEPLINRDLNSVPFDLTATASSGLAVAYTSSNTSVATISGSTVTIRGVGSTTVTATQPGNANYTAAASRSQTLVVTSTDVTPPVHVELSPANSESDVDINVGTLTVRFSEPVFAGTVGRFRLRGFIGGTDNLIKDWNFNTGTDIAITGDLVTLSNVPTLEKGAIYYVQFSPGSFANPALSDVAGNMVQDWTSANGWRFRTEKQDQTITFDPIPDRSILDGQSFSISPTSSSGLTNFTITSSDTEVATVNGFQIRVRGTGTTEITVRQNGNFTFNPAEATQTLTVNKADQTITFPPIANQTYGNGTRNLNVSASSNLSLSYESSDTDVVTVSSIGRVTIVGAGTATITASQPGNDRYNPAADVSRQVVVAKKELTAIADNKSRLYGASNPAFTIRYTGFVNGDDASDVNSQPIASTQASASSDVGSYPITLSAGNDNNYSFDLNDGVLIISKRLLEAVAEDKERAFGEANPPLTIAYSGFQNGDDASNLDTEPTISTPASPMTNVGSYRITLSGGSDNNYTISRQNGTLTIIKADQTINIDAIADKEANDPDFDVVASTNSNLTLTYRIQSGPATIVGRRISLTGATGTVVVEVSQAGNGNYNAASSTTSFNVTNAAKQDQTITFEAIADKTFGDTSFGLSATASSNLPVSFRVVSGPITISGNQVTITGAGTAEIAAEQSGNDDFNPAPEVTRSFNIAKADQTISISAIPDKMTTNAPFTVQANTTSSLSLDYAILSGPATISGTRITLDGNTGEVVVEVSQLGNANYNAATAQTSFIVNDASKQNQTITFSSIADQTYGDQITLSATASSGLPVSYAVTAGMGTINADELTIEGVGSFTIEASQLGDATYNVAPPVSQTFTTGKAKLEVRAEDITIPLGADIPSLIYKTSGFKLNDNITTIDVAPRISTEATSTSPSGQYVILLTGGEDDVYDLDLINGTLTIEEALGLEELDISIYPNPVSETLMIEGSGIEQVQLFSFEGKEVASRKGSGELHLEKLPSGVYLLRVEQEGAGTSTVKVIKSN